MGIFYFWWSWEVEGNAFHKDLMASGESARKQWTYCLQSKGSIVL